MLNKKTESVNPVSDLEFLRAASKETERLFLFSMKAADISIKPHIVPTYEKIAAQIVARNLNVSIFPALLAVKNAKTLATIQGYSRDIFNAIQDKYVVLNRAEVEKEFQEDIEAKIARQDRENNRRFDEYVKSCDLNKPVKNDVVTESGARLEYANNTIFKAYIDRFENIVYMKKGRGVELEKAEDDLRRDLDREHVKLYEKIRTDKEGRSIMVETVGTWDTLNPWGKNPVRARTRAQKIVDELTAILDGTINRDFFRVATLSVETPAPVQEPAPVVVVAADDRDDVMKEYLTKYDFKKADAVPSMLLDSINKGCPLWSFKWFGFAELPRRYFNGACFSVNNMILLAFHGGYYVSLTEARRILGDKATPKEGAIARAVLRPVFKGAKNLRKSDLDALRNCEEIDDDTRQRHPDFYMVERVYDQTAFDGLELKKEKELPQNENERNAQAENIFRAFCKANNIGFLETEGNGQAVTQIRTNGLGKVESITINMPSISQFKSATAYYSVLFHEATHAANAVNGCQLTKKREELSAEIGSCIVLNTLGFDPAEYIDDSAHYVQRFKDCANEKNAIKKAWKYAQASALLILDSFINETEEEAPAPVEKQETAPAPVQTVEPKTEAPAPVEPDDDDNARKEAVKELLETLDSFNAAIAYAATTGGIVHMQKAEEIKKEVASLIEKADNLGALDSKTLARFETLCKNIAIVAIKNNLARLVDDTSRNWDQYQRAALQTLREIETSETVRKNEKLQWQVADALNNVNESKTSDDVRTILKNLVNAI